ncbi:unnamed protein product [Moneuplotes crassus]|uniref:Uncharacterized protein n=1 Tax=Euplotes crassus TaxID=5936 RepID=A0AAD1X0W7_EUPCR|nr:unnamed protein product [Moneuplotes crassus]
MENTEIICRPLPEEVLIKEVAMGMKETLSTRMCPQTLLKAKSPCPNLRVNKGRKKRLIFKHEEEKMSIDQAEWNHRQRREKLRGSTSLPKIQKGKPRIKRGSPVKVASPVKRSSPTKAGSPTKGGSPIKVKKKKRLIISGGSPVKLQKIQSENNTNAHDSGIDISHIEIKLFLQSSCFTHLQESISLYGSMIRKDQNTEKFDIETEEGQATCARFLSSLKNLCISMGIERCDRQYIDRFSKAYKILYKEDNTVYLPEIFDSAQEGYSHLWVNGEKYVFSEDVLQSGEQLKRSFYNFQKDLEIFERLFKYEIKDNLHFREVQRKLKSFLERFDKTWTTYEKNYILELMVIESDSRRYVQHAVDANKELSLAETDKAHRSKSPKKEKSKKIKSAKEKLICCISKINSVANTSGKGRDDLGIEVLEITEKRKKQIEKTQSPFCTSNYSSFYKLYNEIIDSFNCLRLLLSKYSENIEIVDPQLKNNQELVDCVTKFEDSWSKGKLYFSDDKKFNCFIILSQYIDYLCQTYPDFKSQIECRDYELFMIIPQLVIQSCAFEVIKNNMNDLGMLNQENEPKLELGANFTNIIVNFSQEIIKNEAAEEEKCEENEDDPICLKLSSDFTRLIFSIYKIYKKYSETSDYCLDQVKEEFETGIIADNLLQELPSSVTEGLSTLKPMSIELQRAKPSEWNELLDICMA